MDEKSSQTSEMTVKISEKRSELALERAWGVHKEKEDAWLVRRRVVRLYDGTALCRIFESQNVLKSCFLALFAKRWLRWT